MSGTVRPDTTRPGPRRGARMRDRALVLAVCLIVMDVPVWSRTPAPGAPPAKAAGPARPAKPAGPVGPSVRALTAPHGTYRYNPVGRRDPFVSLLDVGTTAPQAGQGVQGLAGLSADAISVKGILQSGHEYVAMVQGPDGKTYLARVHDRLADGTITAITLRTVVIEQDVRNPLSLVKQRVISKTVGGPTK
ncbi:MAG TPA: hypothetical protein VNE16_11850 [Vicinamibacterales bacterium]|nr:hypothetical protein [Vicinamibacterales bacterium]